MKRTKGIHEPATFHCLSVDCWTLILFAAGSVPTLQGAVEVEGIDSDEDITTDVLAWNDSFAVFATAPEALTRLLAKATGPVRDGLMAAHSARNGPCGDGLMKTSLGGWVLAL